MQRWTQSGSGDLRLDNGYVTGDGPTRCFSLSFRSGSSMSLTQVIDRPAKAGRVAPTHECGMACPGPAIAGADTCISKPYLFSTAAWLIGPPRSRADRIGLPLSRKGVSMANLIY